MSVDLGVTSAQGPDDQAKLEVQNMEKQWREAWVQGDADALDLIHANDYLVINYAKRAFCGKSGSPRPQVENGSSTGASGVTGSMNSQQMAPMRRAPAESS